MPSYTIAGIGRIRVRPAIRDRNKLLKRLETAEDQLRTTFMEAGCADVTEAERQWGEREVLERDLGDAHAELARLVPGDPQVGLAAGIGALREHVDILRLRLREGGASLGLEALPSAAQAAADARAAEDEVIVAAEALTQTRAELDGARRAGGKHVRLSLGRKVTRTRRKPSEHACAPKLITHRRVKRMTPSQPASQTPKRSVPFAAPP